MPPLDLERSYGIAPLTAGSGMSKAEYGSWLEANLWRPSRTAGLEVADDISEASWIGDNLQPGAFQVGMMVPDCFEAYARLFFPFVGERIYSDDRAVDNERITWAETARRNGRVAHALMEAETISAANQPPQLYSSFSTDQETALWPILERHTGSQQAWFLLWDGFGGVDPRPFESHPKVEHWGRSYHLLHGPLAARDGFSDPPSYIWPDDRAWCLITDIDWYWAYAAGTKACIHEIVATPILDAFVTVPSNLARSGMDTINDPDGSIPRTLA